MLQEIGKSDLAIDHLKKAYRICVDIGDVDSAVSLLGAYELSWSEGLLHEFSDALTRLKPDDRRYLPILANRGASLAKSNESNMVVTISEWS